MRKYVKKFAKRAGRAIKRRYYNKKSGLKVGQIAKDVMLLKSVINSEKKRFVQQSVTNYVAQTNANTSGHYLFDCTPNITQGVGYSNKIGNSFKLHASHFEFQFTGQANMISGIKLKIMLIQVVGQPFSTVTDILGKFVLPNQFLTGTYYDMTSSRDPDYFRNFRVIRQQYVYIAPDSISGEQQTKYVKMGTKYGKGLHIRTNDNDPTLSMGQILLMIVADRGNWNTSTPNTATGVPVQGVSTGVTFSYAHTHYFYDN